MGRLVFLQIVRHDFYGALAKGQQKFLAYNFGERGEIFLQDKDGNLYPLAVNKNWPLAYVSPNEIAPDKKEETAKAISEVLELDKNFILEKFQKDSLYELIKSKLTKQEESALRELNLPGIYINEERGRYYSQRLLASNVSGFLGGEGIGQYGVEGYWDDALRGREGLIEEEGGYSEHLLSAISGENRGLDLILTIDYNIQYFAEKLLKQAKENLNIEGGQIIVIEPASGKIIALANSPAFDPNDYAQVEDFEIFQNGATQKIFEPGSVFKAITMASALDQGKITPKTTYVDEGYVKIGGSTIYNYAGRVWGQKTMTEVLENSINTGAVFAEEQIGSDIFLDYIEKFGFFEITGVDLQGEEFSENKEFKKGYAINFATAAFGQGIEITPIQLIRAYSAIANGGKLVRPYLVEKIVGQGGSWRSLAGKFGDDKIIKITAPKVAENQVISQNTISKLTTMLVSVIENGFAKKAKIPGYYIAGKSGTAQVSFSALGISKRGYSDKTWQSFIGFAPAFNPRFLVLVKLDNPEAKTAEYSAMPIFRELAKYIIDYWQIPPDYEGNSKFENTELKPET